MRLEYDEDKRDRTLAARALDFADAGRLFDGLHFSRVDDRRNYGETRIVSTGILDGMVVVIVWTQRADARRIISMRKADGDERGRYLERVGRPG